MVEWVVVMLAEDIRCGHIVVVGGDGVEWWWCGDVAASAAAAVGQGTPTRCRFGWAWGPPWPYWVRYWVGMAAAMQQNALCGGA